MILNVDPQLSQWDAGRSVSVSEDSVATHIHFANQGDSKAVIIEIVDGSAKIPDFLLHTGKTVIAYEVLDGVTLGSRSFPVRKREKPESYVYEEDHRNYIYELINNAETAVASATLATEEANIAAISANLASTKANEATISASVASESANLAAQNANEAAAKASNTAKSLMVIGGAKGSTISLNDAIDQYLVGLRVFGKTTQDGTPTPDAPVELVSVGDSGSVTVNVTGENDAQSMTIATPNGLPGIPVTKGGNYTDASGQQWVCDEVDFARGVYVQRVKKCVGSEIKVTDKTVVGDNCSRFNYWLSSAKIGNGLAMSSHFWNAPTWIYEYTDRDAVSLNPQTGLFAFFTASMKDYTVAEFKEFLSREGVEIQFALATPIETPLSEEELAAYASLHTYRNNTTVSNDAGAWMVLEYVMDAKKYIDSMLAGPIPRIASVSLPASAWKGSDTLYSQVVTIPGVTPYSKVDLLPSVEQLAIFHNKDVAFVTENEDGVVTVYAIGDKPLLDYTMQVQITEVTV